MKQKLITLALFFTISFGLFSQSNVPSRSPSFTCACTGNGTDIYPNLYFTYVHYQINAKGEKEIIAQYCNYVEFTPTFYVAADGGESFMEITVNCTANYINPFGFLSEPGYDLNEFAANDFETNGKYIVEEQTSHFLKLKYQHPTKQPFNTKFISVFPELGLFSHEIQIYHPPVMMIHGLWADRSSFTAMEAFLLGTNQYDLYQLYRADYESTNSSSFFTNFNVPQIGIDQLKGQALDNYLACSKVDVVCHSMGGLLTRWFTQTSNYLAYKNIGKIITCNTPHQGSQMANWLLDNSSIAGPKIAARLSEQGMSTSMGAVADLSVGSTALLNIQNGSPVDPVRVHAINTVYAHDIGLPTPFQYIGGILPYFSYQVLNFCLVNYLTDIFDSPDSDLVVSLESQSGGLNGLQTSVFNNQKHTGSVANAQVMLNTLQTLNLESNSSFFAPKFNKQVLNYGLNTNCIFESKPNLSAKIAVASLQITAPTVAQNVVAGTNLTISFTSTDIDSVIAFLPYTQERFAISKVKFSNNTFTLPTDIALLGPVKLVLEGYSATNEIVALTTVEYNQITNAVLESIKVYPTNIYLHTGDNLAITITGLYNDGISRDITNDNSLTYTFANNNASKTGQSIQLNNPANDVLTVDIASSAGARISAPAISPVLVTINNLNQKQTPLPITLISFTGKSTEKGNLLEWKTANEINFSHFEIEKSPEASVALTPDGGISNRKFEKIGQKQSNESRNYKFQDSTPPSGAGGLYRLRMVDLDGKFSYSKIIFIKNENENKISAFPNPFSNQISVENTEGKSLQVILMDLTGKEIIKTVNANQKRIELNTEKVGAGIYFLQIKEGEKSKIQKVIKQ